MTLRINTYQSNSYKKDMTNKAPVFKGVGNFSKNAFKHSKSSKLLQSPNIFVKAKDVAVEGLARGFGLLASTKPVQYLAYKLHNSKNGMMHLISAVSIILTASTINNINRSKKIEEKQKLPLVLNQILTTAVTVTGAYTVDNALNKGYKKFVDTFKHVNKDLVAKNPASWGRGLDLTKKLAVTGLLYRYVGPVLVTPVSNKLSNKIVSNRENKKQNIKVQKVATQAKQELAKTNKTSLTTAA